MCVLLTAFLSNASAQGLQGISRLGFYDAAFTRNDGWQQSSLSGMNSNGVAFGWSDRFSGSTFLGHSPWVHDATNGTRAIGLAGTEFTRADGFADVSAVELSAGGWLRGEAARFLGTSLDYGQAAWVADAATATTTAVGFYDPSHTGAGYQFSEAVFITDSGVAGGFSRRYGSNASVNLGQSAWLAKPVAGVPTTTRVGLSGGTYSRNDGFEFSVINRAVEEGWTGGYSRRFGAGGADLGQTAWVAQWTPDASGTAVVGLYDAEHTDLDGYQFSRVQELNGAGQSGGYSERFNAGSDMGRTAWVGASGGTGTTRIGFVDAAHTRSDGYRFSEVVDITDSGWLAGYSKELHSSVRRRIGLGRCRRHRHHRPRRPHRRRVPSLQRNRAELCPGTHRVGAHRRRFTALLR